MKHSIAVKFIAIVLCALSVVGIAASGFGILFMEANNLYNEPLAVQQREQLEAMARDIAWTEAQRYAAETLSNCPIEVLEELFPSVRIHGTWVVDIVQAGETVYSIGSAGDLKEAYEAAFTIAPNFPVISYQYTIDENGPHPTEAYIPSETTEASVYKNPSDNPLARTEDQTPVYTDEHYDQRWDEYGNMHQVVYTLNYYQGPEYEVKVQQSSSSVLGTEFALMSLL